MSKPLQVAVIGLGGFARLHHEALQALQEEGSVELIATCDSQLERFAESDILLDLERRGVRIYRDYLEMLDAHQSTLDFVTVPTPIPLHAPMHRACIERGLAVYLEKPPTLDWRELERMIATESEAPFQTQVGFNFIVEEARQNLKNRLLAGEFGALKRAGIVGHWPRADTYFTRASWAGRLRVGQDLILDSCAGNALAHYVHNLLFWCGNDALLSWGEVESVEAELYRAHSIESFDTAFARGTTRSKPMGTASQIGAETEILLGVTHAGSGSSWQREWFECENASVIYGARGGGFEISWVDGRRETGPTPSWPTSEYLTRNLRHFTDYLRGQKERPLTTLSDSRSFVHFNDLLFVAARHICDVPPNHLQRETDARGQNFIAIQNIEAILETFARNGRLPSEIEVPWGKSGGRAVATDLPQLEQVINALSNSSK